MALTLKADVRLTWLGVSNTAWAFMVTLPRPRIPKKVGGTGLVMVAITAIELPE